jgi:hypothetical protein
MCGTVNFYLFIQQSNESKVVKLTPGKKSIKKLPFCLKAKVPAVIKHLKLYLRL